VIELVGAGVTVTAARGEPRVLLHPTTLTLTERRVAVIGANGSGKSTLARLVNGLRPATTGRVRTLGFDVAQQGAQVRARVGFVFTDPDAQLVMPTAVEDVALSLRRRVHDAAQRDATARAWLERIGLGEHATTPVHALSGGQKQLLALAGVLATEPQVLVCDEPTTLLDLRWRRVVDGLLDEVDAQLLLVTHDLDAALRADRVLVVDEGRVVHDGPAGAAVEAYQALMVPR
jgi:biotin transport system ATP-binding protein